MCRWSCALLVLLLACHSKSRAAPDAAGRDAAMYVPCGYVTPPPAGTASCSQTCGNGAIDRCYLTGLNGEGCPEYVATTEACDGSASGSAAPGDCVSLGFYGGSGTCNATCDGLDTTGCQACAPTDDACVALPAYAIWQLVASGASLAAVADQEITIYDGVTATSVVPEAITSIVPTPSGWLLSLRQSRELATLAPDGTLGSAFSIGAATAPELTFGPGGLVAAMWGANGQDLDWVVALVDPSSGATVVPAIALSPVAHPSSTTDGSHDFYFATSGAVTRIATDGSHATLTGFPASSEPRLFWTGTTGWYVDEPSMTIQLFDATGPTGSPLTARLPGALLALAPSGTQLVALVYAGRSLELVTIDATGAVSAPVVVGGGTISGAALAMYGSGVAVGWDHGSTFALALQRL